MKAHNVSSRNCSNKITTAREDARYLSSQICSSCVRHTVRTMFSSYAMRRVHDSGITSDETRTNEYFQIGSSFSISFPLLLSTFQRVFFFVLPIAKCNYYCYGWYKQDVEQRQRTVINAKVLVRRRIVSVHYWNVECYIYYCSPTYLKVCITRSIDKHSKYTF